MATLESTDMAIFDRVFNINVRGVYNLTRLVAPELIKSKGNIINISSGAGTMVSVGNLPYAMSKAALDHFTRLIALELAPKGVRANTLSPGITRTKFGWNETNYTAEKYEAFQDGAVSIIPMGKVCSAEDIARMIVFLASDQSALVTGTMVHVDGGLQHGSVTELLSKKWK